MSRTSAIDFAGACLRCRFPRGQEPHVQHLRAVAAAVAVGAAQVHVAQELHLDVLEAAAAAGRAAAVSRVEAEACPPCSPAPGPAAPRQRACGSRRRRRRSSPGWTGPFFRWGTGPPGPRNPPARAPQSPGACPAGQPGRASAHAARCTARPGSAWTSPSR